MSKKTPTPISAGMLDEAKFISASSDVQNLAKSLNKELAELDTLGFNEMALRVLTDGPDGPVEGMVFVTKETGLNPTAKIKSKEEVVSDMRRVIDHVVDPEAKRRFFVALDNFLEVIELTGRGPMWRLGRGRIHGNINGIDHIYMVARFSDDGVSYVEMGLSVYVPMIDEAFVHRISSKRKHH